MIQFCFVFYRFDDSNSAEWYSSLLSLWFSIQMARSDFRLRSLLLDIDRQLTDENRKMLVFLIGSEDIPRRLLDSIANDRSASMHDVWEILFDRRKIAVDNVEYLAERLEKIQRSDLAQRLKDYCPLPFSLTTTPMPETNGNRMNPVNLFNRINPWSSTIWKWLFFNAFCMFCTNAKRIRLFCITSFDTAYIASRTLISSMAKDDACASCWFIDFRLRS